MPRNLFSVGDLTAHDVDAILTQAALFERSGPPDREASTGHLLGLMFTEPSLRTRVGFASAAARLGWQSVDVFQARSSDRSMPESIHDTLRTLAGFVDVVVARTDQPAALLASAAVVPIVNGGDGGPSPEHPSQALVDVFAMEQELGPVRDLRIAVCGDLRMRAVRSLLRLLTLREAAHVSVISVPELADTAEASGLEQRTLSEIDDVDVLYVAGIPHRAIPEDTRDELRVTPAALQCLPADSIVLSPMPVIDEIDADARHDPRVRMFAQSDRGVFVRMSLLHLLAADE